jgi:polygalacturonase
MMSFAKLAATSTIPETMRQLRSWLFVGMFLISAGFVSAAPKRYVITDSGAVGDGTTINTQAVQTAIDRCAADGGGVVVVPAGAFICGPIRLKQGADLWFERNAVLKAFGGTTKESAVITAEGLSNVQIGGRGTIDATGAIGLGLIRLTNCRHPHVGDLTLQNATASAVHFVGCEDLDVDTLVIRGATPPTTGAAGVLVDSSQRGHILNCDIVMPVADGVCIKATTGPVEDILIEEIHAASARSGIAIGPEISGGVRKIDVRDCVINDGNQAAIRFTATPGQVGIIENVVYSDIHLRDIKQALELDVSSPAVFRDLRLISVSGPVESAGLIRSAIQNLKFTNCNITAQRGLILENAGSIDTTGLRVTAREGDAIIRK